jgi:pimeloyl-ACP methyl ester carboxylesterase
MTRSILYALVWSITALCAWSAEPSTPYGNNLVAGREARVEGIRLYYEVYGAGVPLVVLHGNGGSISALRYQIDFFRAHRTVIAIDSRGHGKSEMGQGRLTYEQMADDVAALLKQLNPGRADILGWSDGGIVGLLVALRHPEVVRSLAISGASLSPEALKPGDLDGMKIELRDAEKKLAAGDPTRPWSAVCQYLQLMITQPHISSADLARIAAPTLVLAGEHDMIPDAHTREIAAALAHSRLHIFAGAGHGALQEVPDIFNAVTDDFFQHGLTESR